MPAFESLVVGAGLGLIPILILVHARGRRRPSHRLTTLRLVTLYALLLLLLQQAALRQGLPAPLALLSLVLGLLGLGIGVRQLYGYVYGRHWLEGDPGVVERDVARWQRATLVLAIVALLAALLVAAAGFDPAYAPVD